MYEKKIDTSIKEDHLQSIKKNLSTNLSYTLTICLKTKNIYLQTNIYIYIYIYIYYNDK